MVDINFNRQSGTESLISNDLFRDRHCSDEINNKIFFCFSRALQGISLLSLAGPVATYSFSLITLPQAAAVGVVSIALFAIATICAGFIANKSSLESRWEEIKNSNFSNKSLLSHAEEKWSYRWSGCNVSISVREALIGCATVNAMESDVKLRCLFNHLGSKDLLNLYELLHSHAEKEISEENLSSQIVKEMEIHIYEMSIDDELFHDEFSGLCKQGNKKYSGDLLEILERETQAPRFSWEDALTNSSLTLGELVSHIDYWFRGSMGGWPEWMTQEVREEILILAQVRTKEEAETYSFHEIPARNLVALYRVLNSYSKDGNQSAEGFEITKTLTKRLRESIEVLPEKNISRAENVCRILLVHGIEACLEPLTETLMEKLQIIRGHHGGIYAKNYMRAFNANQDTTFTEESFSSKYGNRAIQMKKNYDVFIEQIQTPSDDVKIPKKIHLIWLGAEAPEDVMKVTQSWRDFHPDWEVKLWGNDDAAALIAEMRVDFPKVGETWDKAVIGQKVVWAERADVLRYCILYKEGGTYVDTDLPCYGKIDDLHGHSEFYISMEQNDYPHIHVGNALIGSKPQQLYIKRCLEQLKPRRENEGYWDIIGRTGPGLVTDQIYRGLGEDASNKTNNTLILPPSYFYPLRSGKKEWARDERPRRAESQLSPWSKGLHLWNFSWN